MKGSKVLSLNGVRAFNFLKENGALVFLTFVFVSGVFFGALFYGREIAVSQFAKGEFEKFLTLRQNETFFSIFFSSFFNLLIYFGLVFISGTSVVGTVISPFVLLWYGFNFGSLSTHLYIAFALKGIALSAVLLIPFSAIFALTLIFCSREAIRFSLLLTKLFAPQGVNASVFENFKGYCLKFLYYLALVLFSALTDGLLSTFFIKFFNF